MTSKQMNYEVEYKSIKTQYDSLIEKNQNDLIKIKQKQKQLSDDLDRIKKEKEQSEMKYETNIKQLQEQLAKQRQNNKQKAGLVVQVKSNEELKIQELEMNARRLIDQNIALTADNTSLNVHLQQERAKNDNLTAELDKLRKYVESLKQDLSKQINKNKSLSSKQNYHSNSTQCDNKWIGQSQITNLQNQLSQSQKQLQSMKQSHHQLKEKLKHSEEETRIIADRERKSMHLLKKKESQLTLANNQLDKLRISAKNQKRKTQIGQQCQKCNQHKQQIQLLKEMVRSTKGMVRVRQIEAERYRIHNQENLIKENKSSAKMGQKSTLPPLKKK